MLNTWQSIEKHVNKAIPTYDKTAKKWSAAIAKGYLTENEIIYLRKYLGHTGNAPKLVKQALMQELDDKIDSLCGLPITPEQTVKGIEWLKNFVFLKNGNVRQTKESRVFGERERNVIKDFKEFKLMGLSNVGTYSDLYLPIYQVVANNGNTFDYTTNMGRIEVVG